MNRTDSKRFQTGLKEKLEEDSKRIERKSKQDLIGWTSIKANSTSIKANSTLIKANSTSIKANRNSPHCGPRQSRTATDLRMFLRATKRGISADCCELQSTNLWLVAGSDGCWIVVDV